MTAVDALPSASNAERLATSMVAADEVRSNTIQQNRLLRTNKYDVLDEDGNNEERGITFEQEALKTMMADLPLLNKMKTDESTRIQNFMKLWQLGHESDDVLKALPRADYEELATLYKAYLTSKGYQ